MELLDSVNANLFGFGVAAPLLFVVYIGGKSLLNKKLSTLPTEFFEKTVWFALLLAVFSIAVSSFLLFQVWNREIESGQTLINNLARVVTIALCLYGVRNFLITRLPARDTAGTRRKTVDVHPLDKMFRHGIHAGIAAVIGLLAVVIIEAT